jgi:hypothetical protein
MKSGFEKARHKHAGAPARFSAENELDIIRNFPYRSRL